MAVGADGRWVAGIGDPSLMGWITVVAYAVAAGLAVRNAAAARRTAVPTGFWVAVSALMLALGVNKQLDLQSWFGEAARGIVLAQGWYEHRRSMQAAFIVLLCVGAVAAIVAAARHWSAYWREYRAALFGVCLLMVFIVLRAVSFHHVDQALGMRIGDTNISRSLETLGVLAIAGACAWWHGMHRRRVRAYFMAQASRSRA